MKDITVDFGTLTIPFKALVLYHNSADESLDWVESYDMDADGKPINAHPLTVNEAKSLAKALVPQHTNQQALAHSGILPSNILNVNPFDCSAIWYTPSMRKDLLFSSSLSVPSGKYALPALLWKASRNALYIYALDNDQRPEADSKLYRAPLFNIHPNGKVCMGSVSVKIPRYTSLIQFISAWENYFFNSYFSHVIDGASYPEADLCALWSGLAASEQCFPTNTLISYSSSLKNVLS